MDPISKKINSLLESGQEDNAIYYLDTFICDKSLDSHESKNDVSIICVSFYIHIVDVFYIPKRKLKPAKTYIIKALGLISQSEKRDLNEKLALSYFTLRASAYLSKYDIEYLEQKKDSNNTTNDYDDIISIYGIKDTIQLSISNYWNALKICEDAYETYSIKNNLANALSRTGRYTEALNLLDENIKTDPSRFQSYASWADHIQTLRKNGLLGDMFSFDLVLADKYLNAIKLAELQEQKTVLERWLERCKIKQHGYEFSEALIEANKTEEVDDFNKMNEYRRFVLSNQLSLNEHSLHCLCRDSIIDNLKIGL